MEYLSPNSIGPFTIGMPLLDIRQSLGTPGVTQKPRGTPDGCFYVVYPDQSLDFLFHEERGLLQLIVGVGGLVTINGANLLGMKRPQLIAAAKAVGSSPQFDSDGFFTVEGAALGGRIYKGEVISISIAERTLLGSLYGNGE